MEKKHKSTYQKEKCAMTGDQSKMTKEIKHKGGHFTFYVKNMNWLLHCKIKACTHFVLMLQFTDVKHLNILTKYVKGTSKF